MPHRSAGSKNSNDKALPSYETVKDEQCYNIDQEPIVEVYGKSPKLAPMCPANSPSMTRYMNENTQKLVEEYGANGLYIDQVASVKPTRCYNPKHTHPFGGGHWWIDAYRKMLGPIVQRYEGKVTFLAENAADAYIDLYDIFLLWGHISAYDFPSLPAVYNQYAWYINSPIERDESTQSYAAIMARSLLWNVRPGWHATWLYTHSNVEDLAFKRAYVEDIMRLRKNLKDIIDNGLLVGEVEFETPPEKEDMTFLWTTWNRNTNPPKHGLVPTLQSAVWTSEDQSKTAVIVVELSGEKNTNTIRIPNIPLDGKKLFRITPEGQRKEIATTKDGKIPFAFQPYEIIAIVIE